MIEITIITLIVGIVLILLGMYVIVYRQNFIVKRFEGFHKSIRRKKKISVNLEGLSIFYAILYFIVAIPLLVIAIIGFIDTELPFMDFVWVFVAVAIVGVIGILYCNLSKRFIQPLEQTTEPS
ncbi:MAG: hypothetical protein ACTSO7_16220 [Candidatus Heimdallarchaeota archaeon]